MKSLEYFDSILRDVHNKCSDVMNIKQPMIVTVGCIVKEVEE